MREGQMDTREEEGQGWSRKEEKNGNEAIGCVREREERKIEDAE